MRFRLTNRHHWFWTLPKAVVALVVWAALPATLLALDAYGAVVPRHAAPESIAIAVAGAPSRVLSARGFVVGGLERGGDDWVPFRAMSDAFVRATIAAEDARFFYHQGFDPEGVLRAAMANRAAGVAVQGGSTITQQLAKSFVGDERTLERKLAELVVARRIETRFSKPEIFEAWANRVYFGAGAEGVGAAARVYFGVEPGALTVAQSALLAALVPAPGRYNPFVRPGEALERRNRVLDRLLETGLATRAEVDAARQAPLGLRGRAELRVVAPEIERAAWRELDALDPELDWRRGGRVVATDVDLVRQRVAQDALRRHLHALDRRQGLRETLATVPPAGADRFREAWGGAEFARSDGAVPARVEAVDDTTVVVWAGETRAVERGGWAWAVPYDPEAHHHAATLDRPADAFAVGDLVLFDPSLGIVQFPRVEGAYASMDLATGMLESVVGGYDPDRSEYDRATQGCRQPGSTFKPVVYSAALDAGYTPASLLRDGPVRLELGPAEEWRPRNADGGFEGHVTLWHALVWSRNLPTLTVYWDIGAGRTIGRARELGITTPMDAVESLALGASCVRPVELLAAYGAFARGGYGLTPRVVAAATAGPEGLRVDNVGPRGPGLDVLSRTRAMWESRDGTPRRWVSERNAYQVGWLLSEVARAGTASQAGLPFPFAGKTGTTNAYDAWFAGFTSRDAAVAWIGSDRNTRPLGRSETGGHLALPAWADAQLPPPEAVPLLPATPPGIEWVDIEPESGRLAAPDRMAISMPFVVGTAPQAQAITRERLDRVQIDRLERDF